MRGATRRRRGRCACAQDFNPRSSCEERLEVEGLPSHRRTISIHAPHARSDPRLLEAIAPHFISIHAPHARSDGRPRRRYSAPAPISIHAPHARSDKARRALRSAVTVFQSTLLMRGATGSAALTFTHFTYFNPRSSCEERPYLLCENVSSHMISIHAPHARSDPRRKRNN